MWIMSQKYVTCGAIFGGYVGCHSQNKNIF